MHIKVISESSFAKWDGIYISLSRVPCPGEYVEVWDRPRLVAKVVHQEGNVDATITLVDS